MTAEKTPARHDEILAGVKQAKAQISDECNGDIEKIFTRAQEHERQCLHWQKGQCLADAD